MKTRQHIYKNLYELFQKAPVLNITSTSKILIVSDLHLGNGSSRDDFRKNSLIFSFALEEYRKQGYSLVLNGDIEELQKFRWNDIQTYWQPLYALFQRFADEKALYKLNGNHDAVCEHLSDYPLPLYNALRLNYKSNTMLIFHGHQAHMLYTHFNSVLSIFLRFIVGPLGIAAFSVSSSNKKKFKTEQAVYNFSKNTGIVSIIGHTHRPLFESLSKIDSIRYRIEHLLRKLEKTKQENQDKIIQKIKALSFELNKRNYNNHSYQNTTYGDKLPLPALFNSGCCIGKKGFTAVEISNEKIRLVAWTDFARKSKNYKQSSKQQEIRRKVLNKDSLDSIFLRLDVLRTDDAITLSQH